VSAAEDNVATVREIYRRAHARESTADLMHPDIEWSMPHPGGQFTGGKALAAFWRDYEAAWTDWRIDLEEVRAIDDERVLVLFTESARGRASGVETSARPAAIWTIRGGRAVRFEALAERDEILRIASEPPAS
jgi:ketosteroid isomerase-like protein